MKAILIRRFGDISELEYAEMPQPTYRDDELLVRVDAAGVNPLDWKIRRGMFRWISGSRFPMVLGLDGAGVVEEVGRGVQGFSVGDRVFGSTSPRRLGWYAEYASLPAKAAIRVPDGLTPIQAAAIPGSGCSALQALRDLGKLESGQSVLVIGASGGIGTFAVQIAKTRGADVTAVCSGTNAELVRGLGADRVIDYKTEDVWDRPRGYDVVFDTVAAHEFADALPVLKRRGVYISTLPTGRRIGSSVRSRLKPGPKFKLLMVRMRPDDMRELAELAVEGRVRPVVGRTFPLRVARLAHELSETGRARGKLVLVCSPDAPTR
jgi:NADPH:quinone reductase-like Zn-dependent oxidoreductase